MARKVVIGVVVLAVALVIAFAARPRPLELQVVKVESGPIRVTVEEDGKTRVRERYTVPAPIAGTLSRVELRAGDAVEPGTVIASLLPLPSPLLDARARQVAEQQVGSARDSQLQAQASIVRAQSAADLAHTTLTRDEQLVARNTISSAELEQAQADVRMKDSELASLRFAEQVAAHNVTQAVAALSRFDAKPGLAADHLDITSPVHGRVLHVLHEDAGPVTAGTAIVELGDLASMEVVSALLSQDAVTVRPGMTATLAHWGGDPLAARVRRVEPAGFTKLSALGVEEQRVNVILDLDAPTTTLGDGFAVEVSVLTWSSDKVLQVPASALFRSGDGWAAFVVRDGRAVMQTVQVGHRNPTRAEVVAGVAEGDLVAPHPPVSLQPNTPVRPVN